MNRAHWVLWFAVVLHATWGLMILVSPEALNPTGTHFLHSIIPSRFALAALLLGISVAAAWFLTQCKKDQCRWELWLALPQQVVMMLSAGGAAAAIFSGKFPDGVVRHWTFIAADQVNVIIIAALHTVVLFDCYREYLVAAKPISPP